jgi:hypothetical protein
MIILSNLAFEQMLLNSVAAIVTPGLPGIWVGTQLTLFTNVIVPSSNSVLSQFTLVDDTVTAAQTVVFGAPTTRSPGGYSIQAALLRFQLLSNASPAVSVRGYVITDTASPPNLLASELIPSGLVTLGNTLNIVEVAPQISLGGSDYGDALWNY